MSDVRNVGAVSTVGVVLDILDPNCQITLHEYFNGTQKMTGGIHESYSFYSHSYDVPIELYDIDVWRVEAKGKNSIELLIG